MPILCSNDTTLMSLRSPRLPSAFTRNLGTRNSEIPFVPGAAPGVRASTRCTMLSVMSWSPQVMKILVPREPVGPVVLADRPGGESTHVGAGLRLGEVHRPGPFAGHELAQICLLLLGGAVDHQRLDPRLGQQRAERERHARRGDHLLDGDPHRRGQSASAPLGGHVRTGPPCVGEPAVGLFETIGCDDVSVDEPSTSADRPPC